MFEQQELSLKIIILFVITIFTLSAIIYLLNSTFKNSEQAVCGNGRLEVGEMCDGEFYQKGCPENKRITPCINCNYSCVSTEIEEGELGYDLPCSYIYEPVCGLIDGEYQTFENSCLAEQDGIVEYTEGECEN